MNPSVLIAVFLAVVTAAAQAPEPRVVDLTASDGTVLKATFFGAGKPAPGILLLHQCNRQRKMWDDLASRLAAAGMNVLTLDFRNFGESPGAPFAQLALAEARQSVEKRPGDVDVAFQFLVAQAGLTPPVIGAAGASCGVDQSILLAGRHPEVKSLVLLSGGAVANRAVLRNTPNVPLFGSAADDDDVEVEMMEWLLNSSGNPGSRFQHYKTGGHGIEMFPVHPELTGMIVDWFTTTLIKTPGRAPVNPSPEFQRSNILSLIDEPHGAAKAGEMLAKARRQNPKASLFSEGMVNQIGYAHIQSGDVRGAVEIFKLNVTAYPQSANACDSLSDAYLAAGEPALARQSAQKALDLLATDTTDPEDRRNLIRAAAEQKLKQLVTPAGK